MRRRVVFVIILVTLLIGAASVLSAQTTVTEENLLRLVKSNAPSALIVKAIQMAKVIDVDTSLENTVALMGKGVSQEVVTVLVDRKEQLSSSSRPPAPSAPAPSVDSTGTNTYSIPDEFNQYRIVVFVETEKGLTPLRAELTKMKSTSPLKMVVTPFSGLKTSGVLEGPKSSIQLPGPKVVVVIRLFEGMNNVDDYQLFPLISKKDHREFTTSKMSVFKGMSTGPSDLATTKFEKVGPNTYRASLELSAGEYGLMTQGSQGLTRLVSTDALPSGRANGTEKFPSHFAYLNPLFF